MKLSQRLLSLEVILALVISLAVAPVGALVDEADIVPTPNPNEENFLASVPERSRAARTESMTLAASPDPVAVR